MTSPSSLPPEIEQRIFDILDLPSEHREDAAAAFRAAHPEFAATLDRSLRDETLRASAGDAAPATGSLEIPEHIGPYRVLERIGAGGMGAVYRAEQVDPVRRQVAIKVIRFGMVTEDVLARFRLERRTLAAMSHHCIASVFDAGSTERGDPYFVMELVEGEPLTHFADRHRLSLLQRIRLFQQICGGVQHAHQKGVVHRDLKPSNILCALEGDEPVAKILDFGLAKVTDPEVVEVTRVTEPDRVMGTLEYMPPEQAAGRSQDIDARSDIYALGVILYELLTGALPFSSEELRSDGVSEGLKRIQQQEPPRPSARLTTHHDATVSEAVERRDTTVERLRRALRGDLDWIVLKAMTKEPERRYASAAALAEDLQRYLDDEPVAAGPPSAGYRLRKFVRKYRVQVAAAVVIAAIAITAAVVVSIALIEAKQRARELQQVSEFQASQLSDVDPMTVGASFRQLFFEAADAAWQRHDLDEAARGERADALESLIAGLNFTNLGVRTLEVNILDPALQSIGQKFAEQPLVQARLLRALASSLWNLGLLEKASEAQGSSWSTLSSNLGDSARDTIVSLSELAGLLRDRGEFELAEQRLQSALRSARQSLGRSDPDTLAILNNLGVTYSEQGRLDDAERVYREAARESEGMDTLVTLANLSEVQFAQGELEAAETTLRDVLARMGRLEGKEHPDTVACLDNLGNVLAVSGELEEAETLLTQALEIRQRTLGDEHLDTLTSLSNLGILLADLGDLEGAEQLLRQALEKSRNGLGELHPFTQTCRNNLGMLLDTLGEIDEAEEVLREGLRFARDVLGEDHPTTLSILGNLGAVSMSRGDLEQAHAYEARVLRARQQALGPTHPETLTSMNNVGKLLADQGERSDADRMLRQALETSRQELGGDHEITITTLNNLATVVHELGDAGEAENLLREALTSTRSVFGREHLTTIQTLNNLGVLLYREGRASEAEQMFAEAADAARNLLGDDHPHTLGLVEKLRTVQATLSQGAESETTRNRK